MELNESFSFEIDTWEWRRTQLFSSGGCHWTVRIFPKGYCGCDHLGVFLHAEHPGQSERIGWKRRACFYFVFLNESGKELGRTSDLDQTFCAESPSWGSPWAFPLSRFQQGFLQKNKLTIRIYLKVSEVVHQGASTENIMLDFIGFQIRASQLLPMNKIVTQHRGFAKDFIPKSQGVRTLYMSLLLGLIETLSRSPQSLSLAELSNAQSELDDLTGAGFKLDWLKSKLEEVSLERKKAGSLVQELDADSLMVAQHRGFAKDFIPKSLGARTAYMNLLLGLIQTLSKSPQSLSVAEVSNAQSELDDLTEAGLKLDWLKTKLEEVSLERKKAGSLVQELDADSLIAAQQGGFAKDFIPKSQGVRMAYMNLLLDLIETLSKSPQSSSVAELGNAQSQLDDLTGAGFKLDMLKSKLEEVSLERKKALPGGSWVQQELEERVKNVELTLSDLKVELDKEKMRSSAARVTSFEFIEFFIKRFFLSCFSISKY